jgi:hypothetical protein
MPVNVLVTCQIGVKDVRRSYVTNMPDKRRVPGPEKYPCISDIALRTA